MQKMQHDTMALNIKEGPLLMFDKDILYNDQAAGLISDLKDMLIVKVVWNKAHTAMLTGKGHLYTFGISSRGQCGRERDFSVSYSSSKEIKYTPMDTGTADDDENAANGGICPPGQHQCKLRSCMICTVCRECTGYSISCLNSTPPDRNIIQEGSCDENDSGCAERGYCRLCANKSGDNGGDIPILRPLIACMSPQTYDFAMDEYVKKRFEEKTMKQWKGSDSTQRVEAAHKSLSTKRLASVADSSVPGEEVSMNGSDIERGEFTRVSKILPAWVVNFPTGSKLVMKS